MALMTDPAVVSTLCVASSVTVPPPVTKGAGGVDTVADALAEFEAIVRTAILLAFASADARTSGEARAITLIVEARPELFALVVARAIARFNARVSPAYTDNDNAVGVETTGGITAGVMPTTVEEAGNAGKVGIGLPSEAEGPTEGSGTA